MHFIDTEVRFKAVLHAERAVVFISFAWSLQSKLSEQVVMEWERTQHLWNPKLKIRIHKLEPDEHPYTWEWLRTTPERGGYGSLVWMKNGVMAGFEPFVVAAGIRDIARRTEQVFGEVDSQPT